MIEIRKSNGFALCLLLRVLFLERCRKLVLFEVGFLFLSKGEEAVVVMPESFIINQGINLLTRVK